MLHLGSEVLLLWYCVCLVLCDLLILLSKVLFHLWQHLHYSLLFICVGMFVCDVHLHEVMNRYWLAVKVIITLLFIFCPHYFITYLLLCRYWHLRNVVGGSGDKAACLHDTDLVRSTMMLFGARLHHYAMSLWATIFYLNCWPYRYNGKIFLSIMSNSTLFTLLWGIMILICIII